MKSLKELREEACITQEGMARRLNISKAHYCNLENGKRRLSYPMAVEISKILDESLSNIFFEGQVIKTITNKDLDGRIH